MAWVVAEQVDSGARGVRFAGALAGEGYRIARRLADMVTLRVVDTDSPNEFSGRFITHEFSDGFFAHDASDVDDGLDDSLIDFTLDKFTNEHSVDLDVLHWQTFQIAQ